MEENRRVVGEQAYTFRDGVREKEKVLEEREKGRTEEIERERKRDSRWSGRGDI